MTQQQKHITIDVQGVALSAQLRRPEQPASGSRPLIVAIHGGTYTAAYFDVPGYSLLDRASANGLSILAIDRLGYGASTSHAPVENAIESNAEVLDAAIGEIWRRYAEGASGIVLVGHSIGGAIAITLAARQPSWPLLGLSVSGVGLEPIPESKDNWAQLPQQLT